jgi:hypothetical protein
VLTWLASFNGPAARCDALPRLRTVTSAMHARLSARWPDAVTPDYPALARPGVPLARLPDGWADAN